MDAAAQRRVTPKLSSRPIPQALIASVPALGYRRGGTSIRALRRPDGRDPFLWLKEDLDPQNPPGSGRRATYAKPETTGNFNEAKDRLPETQSQCRHAKGASHAPDFQKQLTRRPIPLVSP